MGISRSTSQGSNPKDVPTVTTGSGWFFQAQSPPCLTIDSQASWFLDVTSQFQFCLFLFQPTCSTHNHVLVLVITESCSSDASTFHCPLWSHDLCLLSPLTPCTLHIRPLHWSLQFFALLCYSYIFAYFFLHIFPPAWFHDPHVNPSFVSLSPTSFQIESQS